MTHSCIIVEDESILASIIEKYLSSFNEINLVGKFNGPIPAMKFLAENKVDLIILDIQMPILNGIDFAKTLPSETALIFTTAYSEYALQGFELNALDYLLKPVTFERFVKSINRFLKLRENTQDTSATKQNHIIIKSEGALHKINTKSLLYIESLSEYLKYFTDKKKLIVYGSLTQAATQLQKYGFVRIHKSYVVSKKHVSSVSSTNICLSNKQVLPIGRAYKKNAIVELLK